MDRYSAGPRNHPLIYLHNCRHSLVTLLGRNLIYYNACDRAISGTKKSRKTSTKSVPLECSAVLFSAFTLPSVPQNQRDTLAYAACHA